MLDPETQLFCVLRKQPPDIHIVQFSNCTAIMTNQKLGLIPVVGFGTTPIGIERFNLVYQAFGLQKIQRTINGGRCGAVMFVTQFIQNVIGLDWLMTAPYQFQHAAAYTGQAYTSFQAGLFCSQQSCFQAMLMLVTIFLEWHEYPVIAHFVLTNHGYVKCIVII